MALSHFVITAILGITSTRMHSVQCEDVRLALAPGTPRLLYATSEANPALSGYSYATQDLNGGGSNVVFATGADSASRLRTEMNSIHETDAMLEKYPISSEQCKYKETQASVNEQDSNTEVFDEGRKLSKNPEMDDASNEQRASLRRISFVSYPAFRTNLLNLQLPAALPGYHLNAIQSQYYPHNPYARLELLPRNFDFYNPLAPLFYRVPIAVPISVLRHALIASEDAKASVESDTTESSRTNGTVVESNSTNSSSSAIASRSGLGTMTNEMERVSVGESATDKVEPMTTSERVKEDTATDKSTVSSTVKSEDSEKQTLENKVSSTEPASTKPASTEMTIPLTKKSSTETSAAPASKI